MEENKATDSRPLWEQDPLFLNPSEDAKEENKVLMESHRWNVIEPLYLRSTKDPVIAECGCWYVDAQGNITHKSEPYYIECDQLQESDWILHLSGKGWFDYPTYRAFKCAYLVACRIAGVTPEPQVTHY